jgi:hypothetical protein
MNQITGGHEHRHPTLGALLLAIMPCGILAIDIATALLAVGPLFFFPSTARAG